MYNYPNQKNVKNLLKMLKMLKMSIHVNVCMSKVMRTPIKLGIHAYTMYTNC